MDHVLLSLGISLGITLRVLSLARSLSLVLSLEQRDSFSEKFLFHVCVCMFCFIFVWRPVL